MITHTKPVRQIGGPPILDKAISLPGGVIRNERPDGTRWSYPNLHGDVIATANNTGTKLGPTITYDPDGNTGPTRPDTLTGELEPTYLGQHGKLQEQPVSPYTTGIIQMGARLYNPNWGRFLSIDPIEGGCANDYTYGHGDPINGSDLTGQWWIFDDVGRWFSDNACEIGQVAGTVATVLGGIALGLATFGAPAWIAIGLALLAAGAAGTQVAAGISSGNDVDLASGLINLLASGIGGAGWAAGPVGAQIYGALVWLFLSLGAGVAIGNSSGTDRGKCA